MHDEKQVYYPKLDTRLRILRQVPEPIGLRNDFMSKENKELVIVRACVADPGLLFWALDFAEVVSKIDTPQMLVSELCEICLKENSHLKDLLSESPSE